MGKGMKAMVVSVGTGTEGKDVAHGICFSIQHHNPDDLIFLNTSKSRKTTMPFIIEECNSKERKWKEVDLSESDDVERIALECQTIIQELVKEGFHLNDMVVDYTSGTKAMSAGLTIAAMREKVGILSYVTGKRGEGGRVISGTERVLSLIPNQIFTDDLFKEAVDSFNSYHFDISLKILEETERLLSDPEFLKKNEILKLLCRSYGSWDRFEVKEAFELLKSLRADNILRDWGIDRQTELNKQALYQAKENIFCHERIFDLLENAIRRGDEERKFDDAVARLYRLCEYIAQFELNKRGLYKIKDGKSDTSDLDLSKLPPALQEKYSKYTDQYDGKVKVHLSGNYNLLYDLNHPLGIHFKNEENRFKKLMGLRDLSILAHGFNPISLHGYREMLELIKGFIQTLGFDQVDLKKKVRFPKISLRKEGSHSI